MKELEYPFDCDYIIRKKKSIKKQLINEKKNLIEKNIAILGGSTTSDIKLVLELFLLNYGIQPNFYESEYNQFWQDGVFGNEELDNFKPDIIFIHTTNKNIENYPIITDSKEDIDKKMNTEFQKFKQLWESLNNKFNAVIIQNNFDYPFYRILGNKEATDIHGKINYITKLNLKFAEYAEEHENFLINDINYQSASYGIDKWADEFYWHMYKYALAVSAIPVLAYNVANIIKAVFGKNKKGIVLDLDNTLWGGIVGDDGVENLTIGKETSGGQVYTAFQEYLNEYKNLGILLCVNSKNDEENAIAGLNHPEGTLRPDDFVCIKANWSPKSQNMVEIAQELNLGVDSLVFVDDNPAEREIINQQLPEVVAPNIGDRPEYYIKIIDKSGFFETVNISNDDLKKNKMYKENAARNNTMKLFNNYGEYLESLEMEATIEHFIPMYMARIAQLTNKSNQFNLTTKRYTQAEIEACEKSKDYITLYGKLKDKFGDNGVISVVIGNIEKNVLNIDLWIMSCRVLKRDMEFAMMDKLVEKAKENNIDIIRGYYYPTTKNNMVKDFYKIQGFDKIEEDDEGNTTWELKTKDYKNRNNYIKVEGK